MGAPYCRFELGCWITQEGSGRVDRQEGGRGGKEDGDDGAQCFKSGGMSGSVGKSGLCVWRSGLCVEDVLISHEHVLGSQQAGYSNSLKLKTKLTLHWNPTMLSLSSTTSLCPKSYTPSLYLTDGIHDGVQDGYLAYSTPQTLCLHKKPAVKCVGVHTGLAANNWEALGSIRISECNIHHCH